VRPGPIEDPDDVHTAIAARVSGALHLVKKARALMEAAVAMVRAEEKA
jgi:hypothetical protein